MKAMGWMRWVWMALVCVCLRTPVLASDTTYTVGVENLGSPFSHTEADGSLGGIAVELLHLLEERTDLQLDIVELTEQTEDMDFDFTMLLEDDGTIAYQKSLPFLSVPLLLVQKEVSDESAPGIGILNYYGFDEARIQAHLGSNRPVVVYETLSEMTADFDQGAIYYMVISTTSLTYVRGYLESQAYLSTPVDMSVDVTLRATEQVDAQVMAQINEMIEGLTQEEIQLIQMENAVAPQSEPTLKEILKGNPELFWVPVALGLLLLLMVELRNRKTLADIINIDALTGLHTKHYFLQAVEKNLAKNPDVSYTLLSLDFDNFKYINEIYGYEKGNEILQKMAQKMMQYGHRDSVFARAFADRFLVLVKTESFKETMAAYASGAMSLFDTVLDDSYMVTISMGVYTIVDPKLSVEAMIDCADLGRSLGKGISETTVGHFAEDMIQSRSYNSSLVAGMEHGIAAKEFVVEYQPKMNLHSGKIEGAEALVRWNRNGTLILPNDFIPLFEQNRFIQKLDYYMFEQVCVFLQRHPWVPPISVNFSGYTLERIDLVKDLMDIANRYGIDPSRMEIEMTETALVQAHQSALTTLNNLRAQGFRISMDDFGVGVSSLTRLQSIPFDVLKIDRGLVLGHMESEKGASVLRNIFRMAQDLQVQTVAEGIETQEHLKFLLEYGCDYGQGYYFAKSLNEADFLAYLTERA